MRGATTALEADQLAERFVFNHLLLDDDVRAVHIDLVDTEFGLFVFFGQAVDQVEAGRYAVRGGDLGQRRQRVAVQLGRGTGKFRKGADPGAVGFVDLVEHGGTFVLG